MKACRDTASAHANEDATSGACPHWRWRSLLMWLPQPALLKTISAGYCCMQQFRTIGAISDGDRPLFCCKKQGGSCSTRRCPLPCARMPATGELVHYSIAELSAADAVPVSAIERPSEAGEIPRKSPIPELSLPSPVCRSRTVSPNRKSASSRATSPPSYPRLSPTSVEASRIEESQRFLVYQQTQQNTPRQLPSRCGDYSELDMDRRTTGSHSSLAFVNLFHSHGADPTKSRLNDVPPQHATSLAVERPHSPTHNGENCIERKVPALEVLENPSRADELNAREAARTSPEQLSLNPQVGIGLPSQLKTRTHHAQHEHGKGLSDHFSTPSICGNVVAPAEHPEELFPQSALQKKTPRGHCHTEAAGSSGGSGPSNELHLGSAPLLHSATPSTQPAHNEVVADGLQIGGLLFGQLQTEVMEKQLNKPEQTNLKNWLSDQTVQHEEGARDRIRSILSQEELLEVAEKNVDAASNTVAEYTSHSHDTGATEDNGQSITPTASPDGRILRSQTVTVPVFNASRVPRDIPLRRETTLVHWNHHKKSSPSVDCPRGRRKTGTSVNRPAVRRSQSDAHGFLSGDVNVPHTSGGALGTLTEGLQQLRAPQWRGISVPRRSPQRLKEHLITRNTPENHIQYGSVSPSPCCQDGTMEISADGLYEQEWQVSPKERLEGHMTFSSDTPKNSLGDKKETCFILFSRGGRSTFQVQICQTRGCGKRGKSHAAKEVAMITCRARTRASADRLTRLPGSAIQTTKTAREAYKKPHKEVHSFSSQLRKGLRRRSTTRRAKCRQEGQDVVVPHRGQKRSHGTLCKLGKDDGATPVEQAPTSDRALKDSRTILRSMEGRKTASPILKRGLSGDKGDPQDKMNEAYVRTGQETAAVEPKDSNCARSSPQRSYSNSFTPTESLVGGTLRGLRAASREGGICNMDRAPQNVMTCKGQPMEVSAALYSHQTCNRRAASCIEPGSHGMPKLRFNGSPLRSYSDRGSRSLSFGPGGAEDVQTALVPLRLHRQASVKNSGKATLSQLENTPSMQKAFYEECTGSRPRRSLEEPPRPSEAEPLLGSLEPPDETGKVARTASTIGPADALPLRVDGETPRQETSTSRVTRGGFWSEGRLKTKMLISGISTARSQTPCIQQQQTRSANVPPHLPIDSRSFGSAATSAQLPQGPGPASAVKPDGVLLGLSMAIHGQFPKVGLTDEAVHASSAVDAPLYFFGPHIARHSQSMLLAEGGGGMGLSSNERASHHPDTDPTGISRSSLWAAPCTALISHSAGQGGCSEGKTVRTRSSGESSHGGTSQFSNLHFCGEVLQTHCCIRQAKEAPNLGDLCGGAANYPERNTFVHRLSDPQEESALPSVVHPCPAVPKPLPTRERSQEPRQRSNYCSATDDSRVHPSDYCSTVHIQGGAGVPGRTAESLPGTLREATAHPVQSAAGAHRCSVAVCHCPSTCQENISCHAPVLCSHYMREGVLPVLRRGTLFRRCCVPRKTYLREEALRWRIQSQRKHVYLLNKHITIQQQQLQQALLLQQTQFQERLTCANVSNSLPGNYRTVNKTHFGQRLRQLRLKYRKTRTVCSRERPFALFEAAAAATAAALAVVNACEQRACKMLAGHQARGVSLGDTAKLLTGTWQSECFPSTKTERPPGPRKQPITANLSEEALQENPGISHTESVSEHFVQPTAGEVPSQPQQSYTVVARDRSRCLSSSREADDPFIHPLQDSADKKGRTLELQLALPQISQPDPAERLLIGQPDPGPTLPRAASEPACPKLAVGLELSFPSPGSDMPPKKSKESGRSYSRMEVTLSPSLPGIRSVPILKLQSKPSAACNWEGASQGRRAEPSDYLAYVAHFSKCNSMPATSTSFPIRGNLGRGSRGSRVDSPSSSSAIRDCSRRQRGDIRAKTSTNKAGDNPLREGLHGTPARYRCNAIPMAYHRDPSISIFSQLFEDSFRRQRNLLILRRQKHLGSIPRVRPQRNRGGGAPQQRPMLSARSLASYDATSRSGEATKVVNKKQTFSPRPGRTGGPHEALKEEKVHYEISAMHGREGPVDNSGIRGKSLLMEDDVETQLCFHAEALCPAAAQAIPHRDSSICMHAATSSLMSLPPHTESFGTFVAAMEAESIN